MANKSVNRVLNQYIIEMEDAFDSWRATSKQNPKAKAHKHAILRNKVQHVVSTLITGINQGVLKADHTGLLLGVSSYDPEINKIALEEAQKIELSSPGDIGAANEARIKDSGNTGFRATLKNGCRIAIDKTTGCAVFCYNGVKSTVMWVAGLFQSFWEWIKSSLTRLFSREGKSNKQAASGEDGFSPQGVVDDSFDPILR